jgi:hypothetical protein
MLRYIINFDYLLTWNLVVVVAVAATAIEVSGSFVP